MAVYHSWTRNHMINYYFECFAFNLAVIKCDMAEFFLWLILIGSGVVLDYIDS